MDDKQQKPYSEPVVVENPENQPQMTTQQPGQHEPMQQLDPNAWFKKDPDSPESVRHFKNVPIKKIVLVLVVFVILGGGGVYAYVSYEKANKLAEIESPTVTAPKPEKTNQDSTVTNPVAKKKATKKISSKPPATTTTDKDTTSTGGSSGGSTGGSTTPPEPTSTTYTITYRNSCYDPANRTITKGDKIKFVNSSNKYMWPASNSHPSHTIYPEFDPDHSIAPGSSWTFTFNKVGTWNYHDHNKPNCTGTITVKP